MTSVKSAKFLMLVLTFTSLLHCSKGVEVSLRHGIEIEDENDTWGGAVPITGGWLTYENARVRCGLQQLEPREYKLSCQILAEMKNGSEVIAGGVEKGLKLLWSSPEFSNANLVERMDCTASKDSTQNQCFLDAKSDSDLKVTFQVKIYLNNQSRREEASVLLPYSVELTAGLIPSMKLSSAQQAFGLENSFIPATSTDIQSDTVCASSLGVFVTRANHVFRMPYDSNGNAIDMLQLVAGSHAAGETCSMNSATKDNCRALDLVLGNKLSLSCTEKGLYVSDVENSRLLFVSLAEESSDLNGQVRYVSNISNHQCVISTSDYSASRTQPAGLVAEDKDGSVILADTCRHLIIRIDASGSHSIVGGTGQGSPSDVISEGARANLTNIYKPHAIGVLSNGDIVFGHWNGGIYKIASNSKAINLIAKIDLSYGRTSHDYPLAIAVDKAYDIIYVSDIYNHKIYKISSDGTLAPFAGNPANRKEAGFNPNAILAKDFQFFNPSGLAVDPKGNVMVSDFRNAMIHSIYNDSSATKVKTIGGRFRLSGVSGISAPLAKLRSIYGMAYGPDGDLYFSTTYEHRIKKIVGDGPGAVVEVIAGNPGYYQIQTETMASATEWFSANAPLEHKLSDPSGIAFDKDGLMYFADRKAGDNSQPTAHGYIKRIVDGRVQLIRARGLGEPTHVAVDEEGLIYALSNAYKAVFSYQIETGVKTNVLADLTDPRGMIYDKYSQILYVADGNSGKIYAINKAGEVKNILDPEYLSSSSSSISVPGQMAVISDGTLYVVDHENGNQSIKKIRRSQDGKYQVTSLFNDRANGTSCSVGLASGAAKRTALDDAIKLTLSGICRAKIMSIASKDTCASDGPFGSITLSFAQKFSLKYASTVNEWGSDEYGSHIITLKRPCHE